MRKNGDLLAGFFFLFFGVMVIFGAFQLPLGTPLDPQPGFFPLLAGAFLAGLSIIHLLHSFLDKTTKMQKFGSLWRPGLLVAGLGIYSVILDSVGYIIATVILAVIVLWILETRAWWQLAGASLTISAASYLLFARLLGVALPEGILKGIL